jgi:hypothetical protein
MEQPKNWFLFGLTLSGFLIGAAISFILLVVTLAEVD